MKFYLDRCRQYFVYIALFSVTINLLMLAPPLFMLQIFDRVMSSRSVETLFMLFLLVVFAISMQHFLDYIRARLLIRASLSIQNILQQPVLDCMLQIMKHPTMNSRRAMEDLQIVQSFLTGHGIRAFLEVPWIPIFVGLIFLFHPYLGWLTIVGSCVLVGLAYWEEKATADQVRQSGEAAIRSQDYLNSALRNLDAIAALGMKKDLIRRWDALQQAFLSKSEQSAAISIKIADISKWFRVAMQSMMMAAAAYLAVTDQSVSSGIMMAATILLGRAMGPIDGIIGSWKSFVKARESYNKLDAMLADVIPDEARTKLPPPIGELEVSHLSFGFNKDRLVLSGINFKLSPGESLGIVGNNGAGKSSLSRLLVGLFKPDRGVVTLDRADVHQWLQHDLGSYIGYLPQSIELFTGTVAENIARMGDAAENSENIIGAAKSAGAHEMILQLPNGYDTRIGEGEHVLSAGQRQMIGLARALFGNPKFIVLDEPNATLDGQSEVAFMKLIKTLKNSRVTLVVITHKPGILRDFDKVLVLDQGRQVMFGEKDEVMKNFQMGIDKAIQATAARSPKLRLISENLSPHRDEAPPLNIAPSQIPIHIEVNLQDGRVILFNNVDNVGECWFNTATMTLRLQFHLIFLNTAEDVSGFVFTDPERNLLFEHHAQRSDSPRIGEMYPSIAWAGNSRFIFDETIPLAEKPQSIILMARCGERQQVVGHLNFFNQIKEAASV